MHDLCCWELVTALNFGWGFMSDQRTIKGFAPIFLFHLLIINLFYVYKSFSISTWPRETCLFELHSWILFLWVRKLGLLWNLVFVRNLCYMEVGLFLSRSLKSTPKAWYVKRFLLFFTMCWFCVILVSENYEQTFQCVS